MRNAACAAWQRLYAERPFAFLTGDLGFMALEPLREAMGSHFVNAGVAEQNMVSVAAGIAKSGLQAWIYSIAPFAYARPFEQIRNDACLNNLAVKIVGNGGGYAYGAMGPSHHAIEDYGALLGLQHMHVFVPAFSEDVEPAVRSIAALDAPAYLRLGRCEKPTGFAVPDFQPWRRLITGNGPVLIGVGPLAGALLGRIMAMEERTRPELWVLAVMPEAWSMLPDTIVAGGRKGRTIGLAEEHVAHGGAGQTLAAELGRRGAMPPRFMHFHAVGYPSALYGSQGFHRRESRLDAESVVTRLLAAETSS